MYESCTGIQVYQEDGLPTVIAELEVFGSCADSWNYNETTSFCDQPPTTTTVVSINI